MGKLLVVSQEREARTRMKIMEDEYVRKNREAKYFEREKILGEGNGKYSEENTEKKKIIEDIEKLEWLVAKRQEE